MLLVARVTQPPVEALIPGSRHQVISATLASPYLHLCHLMQRRKQVLPPAQAEVLLPIPVEHQVLSLLEVDHAPVMWQVALAQPAKASAMQTWHHLPE